MTSKAVRLDKKLIRKLSEQQIIDLITSIQNIHEGKDNTCMNIECICSNNKCGFLKKFDCCGVFSCDATLDIEDVTVKAI